MAVTRLGWRDRDAMWTPIPRLILALDEWPQAEEQRSVAIGNVVAQLFGGGKAERKRGRRRDAPKTLEEARARIGARLDKVFGAMGENSGRPVKGRRN